MAYINFKEEVYVAKIQLEKRVINNEKLFNEIKDSNKLSNDYIPNEKYSYREFNDVVFAGDIQKKKRILKK
ncbi:hypothetical protein A500_02791 [Clostridium sartagoforme AAU1]|uniref:Uncharacterized protein n=1 Tax=Clostridium sartagoforme AAU1 TaxID=1202534 RepID=R9CFI2_9CLOT|nr:hypothetical protein [Clostridium sartagoforme]EOR27775.1 hypothetical protein A500_02791 [Clostridium sartagoforme AAU1]